MLFIDRGERMSDLEILNEDFKLDEYGYALIVKLVEKRIKEDIHSVKLELEEQNTKIYNNTSENWLMKQKRNLDTSNANKLEKEIRQKNEWLSKWQEQMWPKTESAEIHYLKQSTFEEALESFKKKETSDYKLFLILQEAILTPVYAEFPDFPKGLKEKDIYHGIKVITKSCGFAENIGVDILKNTTSFFKGLNNHWGKIIKWTVVGTLATLITAGLAAPVVATAIGGVMGLHGAAALTAGMAALGGGSIAAGGLGMAGGITLFVGGSGFLGAIGGAGLAKTLGKVPEEMITVSMVKIINYVDFLSNFKKNDPEANLLIKRTLKDFLSFKNQFEENILLHPTEKEKTLKIFNTINYTYEKLFEIRSSIKN